MDSRAKTYKTLFSSQFPLHTGDNYDIQKRKKIGLGKRDNHKGFCEEKMIYLTRLKKYWTTSEMMRDAMESKRRYTKCVV